MIIEKLLDCPGDGSGQKFELVDSGLRATAPASVSDGIVQADVAGLLRRYLIGSRCYCGHPGVIPRVIHSTRIAAELIRRGADGVWPANPQPLDDDAVLFMESLDFFCPLAAIYEDTHLPRVTGGE